MRIIHFISNGSNIEILVCSHSVVLVAIACIVHVSKWNAYVYVCKWNAYIYVKAVPGTCFHIRFTSWWTWGPFCYYLINSHEFIYSYREVSNHNSAMSNASRDLSMAHGRIMVWNRLGNEYVLYMSITEMRIYYVKATLYTCFSNISVTVLASIGRFNYFNWQLPIQTLQRQRKWDILFSIRISCNFCPCPYQISNIFNFNKFSYLHYKMRNIAKIWTVRRQIGAGHGKPNIISVFTTLRPTTQEMVLAFGPQIIST